MQAPPEIKWSVRQVATEEPYDAETFDGTSVSAWNVVPIMSLRIKRLRPKRASSTGPEQLTDHDASCVKWSSPPTGGRGDG